jgi:glycerate kinase
VKPVLLAPAAFKGTFRSPEICRWLASALKERGIPSESIPIADGGDGTLDAFHVMFRSQFRRFRVRGPDEKIVQARVLTTPSRWYMEMAEAAGLRLMKRLDPWNATTFGVGQLLKRASGEKIVLGIGGSATNDGGAGMLQALGARLRDRQGKAIPLGGGGLGRLDRIEWTSRPSFDLTVLTDVDHRLLGPRGATCTFGPQKGAKGPMLKDLERNMRRFAKIVERDLGVALDRISGGGAAGGLGAALIGILGARRERGSDYVLRESRLFERMAGASLVVTGEGRIDGTTFQGKACGEILRRATVPVFVLAGSTTVKIPRLVLTGGPSRREMDRAIKTLADWIDSYLRNPNASM